MPTVILSLQKSRFRTVVTCLDSGSAYTQQVSTEHDDPRLQVKGPLITGREISNEAGQSASSQMYFTLCTSLSTGTVIHLLVHVLVPVNFDMRFI